MITTRQLLDDFIAQCITAPEDQRDIAAQKAAFLAGMVSVCGTLAAGDVIDMDDLDGLIEEVLGGLREQDRRPWDPRGEWSTGTD